MSYVCLNSLRPPLAIIVLFDDLVYNPGINKVVERGNVGELSQAGEAISS